MHRATFSQRDCPQLRDSPYDARLLHHLGTLDRMLGDRLPARVRLEDELGPDLARLVTSSLVAPHDRLAA
jgi:hypothetical protein